MNKFYKGVLTFVSILGLGASLASCGKQFQPLKDDVKEITIAATASPHAEILEQAKPLYEAKGYKLNISFYSDYIQPNLSTEDGSVDANYFQHITYLNNFNEEHNTHLTSVGNVHYEPFAIYKGNKNSLADIADGDKILVPNDGTNEARALNLLQEAGLITLKEGVGLSATKKDIVSNPHNYQILELEAKQLPSNRVDAAFAVINGNYALDAKIPSTDALQYESNTGVASQAYANVLCVREENKNNPAIKALYEVLQSDTIKNYIKDTYKGAVIAL